MQFNVEHSPVEVVDERVEGVAGRRVAAPAALGRSWRAEPRPLLRGLRRARRAGADGLRRAGRAAWGGALAPPRQGEWRPVGPRGTPAPHTAWGPTPTSSSREACGRSSSDGGRFESRGFTLRSSISSFLRPRNAPSSSVAISFPQRISLSRESSPSNAPERILVKSLFPNFCKNQ